MARRGSVKDVEEATIDQDTLLQIMEGLDKDGDGTVTKEEFKVPWMKLFPKLKDADFEVAWAKIDTDKSNTLEFKELATHYGFNLSPSAKRGHEADEMTDEQILEALQMATAVQEMQEEQEQRKKEKEEEKRKSEDLAAAAAAENATGKGRRSSMRRTGGSGGSGSDGLRRGSTTGVSAGDRERKKSSAGVASIKMPAKVTQSVDDPDIQFMQMCELGDESAIKASLKNNKDQRVRMEDDKGEMPLHKLARQGCIESLREIMDKLAKEEAVKSDLNWQDKQGKTPIFYAVEYGHDKLVKLFLDRGSDPMVENNNGWTVLHTAVNADRENIAKDILEHARVVPTKQRLLDAADRSKRTALHIASFKSREGEMVKLLLQNGADPTAQDASGNTGAKLAAKTGRRKSKELLEEHMTQAVAGLAVKAA